MNATLTRRSITLLAASLVVAACGPTTINVPGGVGASTGASSSPTATTSASPTTGTTSTSSPSATPSGGVIASASPTGAVPQTAGNFDFSSAQAINAGQKVTATSDGTHSNFYKVSIPAGKQDGILKMTLVENNTSWDPTLTLYDANKTSLHGDYPSDGSTTPYVDQLPVKQGNSYYLGINEAGQSTDYTLQFEFLPVADANEPNDDFATATPLTLGTATPFFIYAGLDAANSGQDFDYFSITVPAGATKVHVKMTDNSSSTVKAKYDDVTKLYYDLYDSSKTMLHEHGADNAQANVDDTADVTAAGQYFIKVYDSDADNSTHAMSLTVTAE